MNNFFEQLKNQGQQIRLSEAEKARMRANIFDLPAAPPVVSRYFSVFDFSTLMTVRSAVALVLVFVLAGSGSAYAAQGSLPGDFLYPVKIGVNERVELAFATTPKDKLKAEARLAERRVAEAEALDAQGRLDESLSLEIEKEFDKHANNVLALANADVPQVEVAVEPVEDNVGASREEENKADEESDEAPSAKVTLKIAAEDEATTAITMTAPMMVDATATAVVSVEDENSDILDSLNEKREVLKKLKIRAMLRGEVRGVEHDGKGKGEGEKTQINREEEED